MRIAEIYKSIQGEGLLTGTESIFVRTSGCNLRCIFCDTPWTSWVPEGEPMEVDEVVRRCAALACGHIVLTGGEPMLPAAAVPLTRDLHRQGWHITIETAGTVYRPVHCDLMSISPKLSNSTPPSNGASSYRDRHEANRWRPEVVERLLGEYEYQIKFVVDRPSDLAEIGDWLANFPGVPAERVLLMPQGISATELDERESWLRPLCERQGFRFCPRMHIHWFGNRRGT